MHSQPHFAKDKAIQAIESKGYRVIGTYRGSHIKLDLICDQGHECSISWHNFNNGTRCRTCKFERQALSNRIRTYSKIQNIASRQRLELLTPFDEYMDASTRLQFRRADESVFDTCVTNIMVNRGQAIDGSSNWRTSLSIDDIRSRLHGSLTLLSPTYINNTTPLEFQCVKGHLFEDTLKNFRNNCPHCNTSSDELYWTSWLEERGVRYKLHERVRGYEVDILLPDYRIGIEVCGLPFHSENDIFRGSRSNPQRHWDKRVACDSSGIRLFTIFGDENESPVWKGIISRAIGGCKKISAQDCEIIEVNEAIARVFLGANHLEGYHPAHYIGLIHHEMLVSILGYEVHDSSSMEIIRFTHGADIEVVGGFNHLFREAVTRSRCSRVIASVDLRYDTGDHLLESGFKHSSTTLGWRWTDMKRTYDTDHGPGPGLYRIFDCGRARHDIDAYPLLS